MRSRSTIGEIVKKLCLLSCLMLLVMSAGCIILAGDFDLETPSVQYLSPDTLHKNPAFSQLVVTTGPVRTVHVGGQNAVTAEGEILGKGDIAAQARQVAKNIEAALAAGGADIEHVIKWRVYVVEGQPIGPAHRAFHEAWGEMPEPALVSVLFVSGLAHPDFLLEVEAVALVPID